MHSDIRDSYAHNDSPIDHQRMLFDIDLPHDHPAKANGLMSTPNNSHDSHEYAQSIQPSSCTTF